MSEEPPRDEANPAPQPAGPERSGVSVAAIAVGAALAAGAFFILRKEPPAPLPPPVSVEPPPQAAAQASPAELPPGAPAKVPFCEELVAVYDAAEKRLSCPVATDRKFAMALCAMPFETKPACIDEVQAVSACVRAQPPAAWSCDAAGKAALSESSCKAELGAFSKCLNE